AYGEQSDARRDLSDHEIHRDQEDSPLHQAEDGARVDAVISTSQQHDLEIKEDVAETQVDSSVDRDCEAEFQGDEEWNPKSSKEMPKTGRSKIMEIHSKKSKNPCRVCRIWYRNQGSLIRHAWSHVDESQTVCGVCGDRLESEGDLKGHLRKHQKTFDCSQCGKPFFTLHSLNRHNSLHTGERPFTCNVCNKSFTHMSILTTHPHCKLTHTNEKPFVCVVCSKGFVANGQLKAHMRVHSGEAPYGCNECGRFFKRKNTLICHVRSHLGIKQRPYECSVCSKAFTQSHCLKTHMKSHQAEENPFLHPSTS
uniref:C2H2-type domain-containing protein n=1 Tax=Amphiprion ocellaris TaxID=80972 RepID=A0AAQ5XGI4_AMPOC